MSYSLDEEAEQWADEQGDMDWENAVEEEIAEERREAGDTSSTPSERKYMRPLLKTTEDAWVGLCEEPEDKREYFVADEQDDMHKQQALDEIELLEDIQNNYCVVCEMITGDDPHFDKYMGKVLRLGVDARGGDITSRRMEHALRQMLLDYEFCVAQYQKKANRVIQSLSSTTENELDEYPAPVWTMAALRRHFGMNLFPGCVNVESIKYRKMRTHAETELMFLRKQGTMYRKKKDGPIFLNIALRDEIKKLQDDVIRFTKLENEAVEKEKARAGLSSMTPHVVNKKGRKGRALAHDPQTRARVESDQIATARVVAQGDSYGHV